MKIIKNSITRKELQKIAKKQFGDLIKAVVDVKNEIMAIGGEFHADEEVLLMEKEGSKREYVWGINLYHEKMEDDWIGFDSIINIKPFYGNRSRNVENSKIREKIKKIVKKLVF
ncbi:hypothetical protein KKA09_04300 [Patescibacteria group bacterium]|nr:hypothetical protein [Patescibacteria group bacterium]